MTGCENIHTTEHAPNFLRTTVHGQPQLRHATATGDSKVRLQLATLTNELKN